MVYVKLSKPLCLTASKNSSQYLSEDNDLKRLSLANEESIESLSR